MRGVVRAHDDLLTELPFGAEVRQRHVPEHLLSLRGSVLPVIPRRDERQPLIPVTKQIIFYTKTAFGSASTWVQVWIRS